MKVSIGRLMDRGAGDFELVEAVVSASEAVMVVSYAP